MFQNAPPSHLSSSHDSSSTLLQILLATNKDIFIPSIRSIVRSILINHVVKTHLETELDATSTTAMPETKEDFDIIALSLSTLVEMIVPLLIQTSTIHVILYVQSHHSVLRCR